MSIQPRMGQHRHWCHPKSLSRDEAQALLARREFYLLAFTSATDPDRHRLAIKAEANLAARDQASVIDSPEEAIRVIYDLRGLEVVRCSRFDGLFHLGYSRETVERRRFEKDVREAEARERLGLA